MPRMRYEGSDMTKSRENAGKGSRRGRISRTRAIRKFFKRVVRGVRAFAGKSGSVPRARDVVLGVLPKGSIGAEVGVHRGNFSARILNTVSPKELHLIDPWKHEDDPIYKGAWYGAKADGQAEMDRRYASVCERFSPQIQAGIVRVHRGYSSELLAELPNAYLDWIYIDGNHLYEFVKKDLELSFEKVKRGGHIAGDDYHKGGWWEGAVKKAVDEFVLQRPVKLVAIKNRQFVLQKLADG
jgi:hypothetical protein